jgi:hypothetical protein
MEDWRTNASEFAGLLARAGSAMGASRFRNRCVVRLPARGRVLVTGDIHDSRIAFEAAVRAADLGRSPDRHIVIQEFIHGEVREPGEPDMSHRMIGRVAELILAHPSQVHPILANHEIAQMRGHLIEKGGVECTAAFLEGLDEAFGDGAQIAVDAVSRFIATMPLAVVCANGVLIAHSLPSASAMRHFDVRVLERQLFAEDFDPPDGAAFLLTWGRAHNPEQLKALAHEWRATVFIVGHEPAPDGVLVREPNAVVLNTGHAWGKVIDLDLASPAPSAHELADAAIPVATLIDHGGDGAGRGALA